ncbi:MAG: hypothetical protein KKA73_26495 [Chloroflexi bacterium]|nr:hypothetical protein [Chloroflexota bacterium]
MSRRSQRDHVPYSVRDLPGNIAAEEAVLGSLLIDGTRLAQVAAFLEPEHFYVERNGWVFQACLVVVGRGAPLDVVTVCDELERQGRLAETGGAAYVTSLLNAVPTAVHAEHYARLVRRAATLRELIGVAGQIARLAYTAAGPAEEVVWQAQALLEAVEPGPGRAQQDDAGDQEVTQRGGPDEGMA